MEHKTTPADEPTSGGQAESRPGPAVSHPAPSAHAAHGGGFSLQTFSSLRYRDYRYLWFGTLFMSAGQWIQQVTLGWLIYEMTGSAVLLGALNGLRSLPFLFASPIAGVAADRMDRRKLLLASQPLLVVTALGMGLLVIANLVEVWHLFAFTLVTAIAWSFNQPIRQSLVPNLVPRAEVMNAVVLSSVGFNLTKILGPALGGLLIAWFGAGGNFLVQALVFGCVLVVVYLMRVPQTPATARQTSALANMREGLSYMRTNRVVFALLIAALVPQVFAVPYQALMPVFQKDVLGVGPEGLGLLLAAPGLGAVISTLGLASLSHRIQRKGHLLLVSLVLLGICLILFALTRSLALALVTLVGVGGFHILFISTTYSLVQLIVPDELRGRVSALLLLDLGMRPIGDLLAGVSTHFIGAPLTVAGMGVLVILLAAALAWRAPQVRNLEV